MKTLISDGKKFYWGKVGEVAEFPDGTRYLLVDHGLIPLNDMKINIHHLETPTDGGPTYHSITVILQQAEPQEIAFFVQIPFRDDISIGQLAEVFEELADGIREKAKGLGAL